MGVLVLGARLHGDQLQGEHRNHYMFPHRSFTNQNMKCVNDKQIISAIGVNICLVSAHDNFENLEVSDSQFSNSADLVAFRNILTPYLVAYKAYLELNISHRKPDYDSSRKNMSTYLLFKS